MDKASLEATIAEMYDYYQQGNSLREVGDKFYRTHDTVHYLFKSRGYPMRNAAEGRMTAAQKKIQAIVMRMYADYENGVKAKDIARAYGLYVGTIYDYFRRFGLPLFYYRQPRGRKVEIQGKRKR